MLKNLTVEQFVEETASGAPTPGGGSVAALVGSIGAALNIMVYNLTVGKKVYTAYEPELKTEMEKSANRLTEIYKELLDEMENDKAAFDKVMAAFKLPKETEEEKVARAFEIENSYKKAMEVPLKSANLCLEALFVLEVFSIYGNVNAITDVGTGALLLYAGIEASLLNVNINLNSLKDVEFAEMMKSKIAEILSISKETKSLIMHTVYSRLNA